MVSDCTCKKEKILNILSTLNTFGINNLRNIIIESENNKKEYGIRFCKNGGDIKAQKVCIGTNCTLELQHCQEGTTSIATFHTHNTVKDKKVNFLSDDDIHTDSNDKNEFACLGVIEKNKPVIKCYLTPFNVNREIIDKRNDAKKLFGIKIREYNPTGTQEGMDNLRKDKYEELDIIWRRFLIADEMLRMESKKAAYKLMSKKNEGADLVLNL